MLPAESGWIYHTETLLFYLSTVENSEGIMQHFFMQKSYLFYILSAFCYNIFAFLQSIRTA